MKLLSTSNTKLEKGSAFGYLTFGLSLAPHKLSGKNFCPHASAGCAAACLNTAGMGVFSNVQAARLKKSLMFIKNRPEFLSQLSKEITLAEKKVKKLQKLLAIRLNVLSDLPWENLGIIQKFPLVQFYDYTKNPLRMKNFLAGKFPPNYHLTFSRSEENQSSVEEIASLGGNVAVVFRNELPEKYLDKSVVNGDESDLRFLDKKSVVVGLSMKGKAKKDESGFVV